MMNGLLVDDIAKYSPFGDHFAPSESLGGRVAGFASFVGEDHGNTVLTIGGVFPA
jgi:hypothetical protein